MADQFWDPSGDEPVAATKLNNEAVFNADDTEDIKTIDTSTAPDGLKYLDRTYKNIYSYDSGSTLLDDENYVIEANAGGGRFLIGPGESEFNNLSDSIIESLPPVSTTIDFSSINAGSVGTSTVTVDGAVANDIVNLGPPSGIESGLMWSAFVSADDTVTIRLYNTTGSPIDPASATWVVYVTKPNYLPIINQHALYLYELLLGEYYTSTTLETEMGNLKSETAFALLCSRTKERRYLLANATTKAAIQGSTTANAIMEDYEGPGY